MATISEELKRLNNLDITYIVIIVVAVGSIYLNSLAKKDVISETEENSKTISNGKTFFLVLLLLCYIYYEYDKNKSTDYSTEEAKKLDMGATGLIILGTIILIYIEVTREGIVDM